MGYYKLKDEIKNNNSLVNLSQTGGRKFRALTSWFQLAIMLLTNNKPLYYINAGLYFIFLLKIFQNL